MSLAEEDQISEVLLNNFSSKLAEKLVEAVHEEQLLEQFEVQMHDAFQKYQETLESAIKKSDEELNALRASLKEKYTREPKILANSFLKTLITKAQTQRKFISRKEDGNSSRTLFATTSSELPKILPLPEGPPPQMDNKKQNYNTMDSMNKIDEKSNDLGFSSQFRNNFEGLLSQVASPMSPNKNVKVLGSKKDYGNVFATQPNNHLNVQSTNSRVPLAHEKVNKNDHQRKVTFPFQQEEIQLSPGSKETSFTSIIETPMASDNTDHQNPKTKETSTKERKEKEIKNVIKIAPPPSLPTTTIPIPAAPTTSPPPPTDDTETLEETKVITKPPSSMKEDIKPPSDVVSPAARSRRYSYLKRRMQKRKVSISEVVSGSTHRGSVSRRESLPKKTNNAPSETEISSTPITIPGPPTVNSGSNDDDEEKSTNKKIETKDGEFVNPLLGGSGKRSLPASDVNTTGLRNSTNSGTPKSTVAQNKKSSSGRTLSLTSTLNAEDAKKLENMNESDAITFDAQMLDLSKGLIDLLIKINKKHLKVYKKGMLSGKVFYKFAMNSAFQVKEGTAPYSLQIFSKDLGDASPLNFTCNSRAMVVETVGKFQQLARGGQ
eukprot:g3729.t1